MKLNLWSSFSGKTNLLPALAESAPLLTVKHRPLYKRKWHPLRLLGKAAPLVSALSLFFLNIPITRGSEVLDLDAPIWEMKSPKLPPLKDAEVYLYQPAASLNLQLILHLKKRQVEVYQGEQLVDSFPVAVGKRGWETPQGEFEVIQMIKNPTWQHPWNGKIVPPGPNNPLGERWIGFWTDGNNYIGFHGTPQENLIGQAVSHGCVRMKNKDVKKLFKLVSIGTPVTVK